MLSAFCVNNLDLIAQLAERPPPSTHTPAACSSPSGLPPLGVTQSYEHPDYSSTLLYCSCCFSSLLKDYRECLFVLLFEIQCGGIFINLISHAVWNLFIYF